MIEDRDLAYIRQDAGLTPEGAERLLLTVTGLLEGCTDDFREARRVQGPPGATGPSPYFEHTHFFPDGGRVHRARFVVSDASAPSGVLRVVFV